MYKPDISNNIWCAVYTKKHPITGFLIKHVYTDTSGNILNLLDKQTADMFCKAKNEIEEYKNLLLTLNTYNNEPDGIHNIQKRF